MKDGQQFSLQSASETPTRMTYYGSRVCEIVCERGSSGKRPNNLSILTYAEVFRLVIAGAAQSQLAIPRPHFLTIARPVSGSECLMKEQGECIESFMNIQIKILMELKVFVCDTLYIG